MAQFGAAQGTRFYPSKTIRRCHARRIPFGAAERPGHQVSGGRLTPRSVSQAKMTEARNVQGAAFGPPFCPRLRVYPHCGRHQAGAWSIVLQVKQPAATRGDYDARRTNGTHHRGKQKLSGSSLWEWWSVQKKCRHGFKTCNLASSEAKKS